MRRFPGGAGFLPRLLPHNWKPWREQTGSIAAQLAYQFEQAETRNKAGHYYELAAAVATATCSLTEAIAHLERALTLRRDVLDQMRLKRQLARLK